MNLPLIREHTDAVIAALKATDLVVGDAIAPEDAVPPYAVVYLIAGGGLGGTLGDPNADATLTYQVTCVGRSRQQAEWVGDKALELLSRQVLVPNRRVLNVRLHIPPGVQRDDQVSPPVFWSTPQFRITTTPA